LDSNSERPGLWESKFNQGRKTGFDESISNLRKGEKATKNSKTRKLEKGKGKKRVSKEVTNPPKRRPRGNLVFWGGSI